MLLKLMPLIVGPARADAKPPGDDRSTEMSGRCR